MMRAEPADKSVGLVQFAYRAGRWGAVCIFLLILLAGCNASVETTPPHDLSVTPARVANGQKFSLEVTGSGLDQATRAVLTHDPGNRYQIVSDLQLWGVVVGVALQGDYAYVANNSKGLVIVNISDPTDTRIVASLKLPGKTLKVVPRDDLLITANMYHGVQLINIAEPEKPEIVSSVPSNGSIFDLDVSGNLVFVAAGKAGLKIVDISRPSSPKVLSQLALPGRTLSAKVVADRVYLAGTRQLSVIDVSSPLNPRLQASLPLASNGFAVAVNGTQILLAQGTKGLLVVDLLKDQLVVRGRVMNLGHVVSLAATPERVYLATDLGTLVLALEPDNMPTLLGGVVSSSSITDVAVRNNYVFVSDNRHGLEVIDFQEVHRIDYMRLPAGDPQVVFLSEDEHRPEHLVLNALIKVQPDPLKPADLSGNESPPVTFVATDQTAIVQQGATVFLGTEHGIHQYDLSQQHPRFVGSVIEDCSIDSLALDGQTLYAAAREKGLLILQLTELGPPQLLSAIMPPAGASRVAAQGDFVYVVEKKGGLSVFNVADKRTPHKLSSIRYPYPINEFSIPGDIVIRGHVAYVADGLNGVVLIDISDPSSLSLIALVPTDGFSRSLLLDGDFMYLADARNGVRVYEISDPRQPLFIKQISSPVPSRDCVTTAKEIGILTKSRGVFWVDKPVFSAHLNPIGENQGRLAFPPIRHAGRYDMRIFNEAGGVELNGAVTIETAGEAL